VVGCASLGGLDEGAGDAAVSHHDARADVTTPRDAGTTDASHDTGRGVDVTVDAALPRETGGGTIDARPARPDAGAPVDAHHEAEAGRDAGVDTGPPCGPIFAPDAAPITCPTHDASVCAPTPLPGFAPPFVVPATPHPLCTRKQINDFVAACSGGADAATACGNFLDSPAEATCTACLVTPSVSEAWGPVVINATEVYEFYNIGGCIALLDPCQAPCAAAFEDLQQCILASCKASCAPGSAAFTACTSDAFECTCAAQLASANSCANALIGGPAAACVDGTTSAGVLTTLSSLFCGEQDGGADAG
jgi:hypothetical protein